MGKGIKYAAALIALYLGVNYASGLSSDLKSGGTAAKSLVNSLQGK